MLKNNQRKPWGGSKDPKMAKKGPKMTQFRDYQKTRPDTRQDSPGQFGGSSDAKTARNLEM